MNVLGVRIKSEVVNRRQKLQGAAGAATCIHNLLVRPESNVRCHKICAVTATAHQLLQQVVKPRKPQRGIDRIARESRHFVRTVSNFWMAKWANSNLSATALLQELSVGRRRFSAGVNHRLYDHALVQCHRTRTARGQRPESESPESLERLKSTNQLAFAFWRRTDWC